MATATASKLNRFDPAHKAQYASSFKSLAWMMEKSSGTGNTRYFRGKLNALMVSSLANLMSAGYGLTDLSVGMYWEKDGNRHTVTISFDEDTVTERKVYLTWVKTAL